MCLSRRINTSQRVQLSSAVSGSPAVARQSSSKMSTTGSHSRSAVSGHKHNQHQPVMMRNVENLSPKVMSSRSTGTSDPIRARYLYSLNIPTLSSSELSSATKMAHNFPPQTSKLEKIHHEALKRDHGEVDEDLMPIVSTASTSNLSEMTPSSSSTTTIPTSPIPSHRSLSSLLSSTSSDDLDSSSSSSPGRRRRGVSFDATVTVKSIPTRNEYSDRIRRHLWTSPEEMHHNAQRNTVEFASEHYDWHRAVEDDDMFVNLKTGERIHPVHYERYLQALEAKKKSSSKSNSSSRDNFLNQSRSKIRNNHAARSKTLWSQLHF